MLAGSSDQSARVIDASTGAELRSLPGPSIVTGVAFASGRPLSASTDGTLRVWPAESPTLRAASEQAFLVATDAASSLLAVGTGKEGIKLWRWPSRTPVPVPAPTVSAGDYQIGGVALSPDGRLLVGGTSHGTVLSWRVDAQGAALAGGVGGLDGSVAYIAVTPDSKLVAAIGYNGSTTGIYRAGDDGRLSLLATLKTPAPQMASLSRDGRLLAVALGSNEVQIFSMADPLHPAQVEVIKNLATPPISLAFSPVADRLVLGLDSGEVSVWDTSKPDAAALITSFGDAHATAYGVAFSPDGRRVVAATADKLVWGWEVGPSPRTLFALDADLGRPWDLRFIDGGRRLVVAGDDGRLRFWTPDDDAAAQQLCAGRGAALSSDEWRRYLPGVAEQDPCR